MTEKQVREIIKRISYKKDVTIQVGHAYGGICITAHRIAEDATGFFLGKQAIVIQETISSDYLGYVNEERLVSIIYDLIKRFEIHEMNEWLKLDGKCLVDPHPELGQIAKLKMFYDQPIAPLLEPTD